MEQNRHEVRSTEIDNGYDTYEEVENHSWADLIITQSPVYWFGNPWIYKKYVDKVFNAGLLQQKMSQLTGGHTAIQQNNTGQVV